MDEHRLATALTVAALRGAGLGAVGLSAAFGLFAGERVLSRARIPELGEPPACGDTNWRAPRCASHRTPVRLAMLGDSLAAGLGATSASETVAARLALGLSAATGSPVHVVNSAVVGARSRGLARQVDAIAASGRPDVAVVLIGANDIVHRCSPDDAVRRLALAVHRLDVLGARVVVGTCPDVGAVGAIAEPLRHLVRHRARALGRAQAAAVRRAGGAPVDLFTLLGVRFREPGMFAADGYHPSPAGYAAAAQVLLPAVCAALGLAGTQPRAA